MSPWATTTPISRGPDDPLGRARGRNLINLGQRPVHGLGDGPGISSKQILSQSFLVKLASRFPRFAGRFFGLVEELVGNTAVGGFLAGYGTSTGEPYASTSGSGRPGAQLRRLCALPRECRGACDGVLV